MIPLEEFIQRSFQYGNKIKDIQKYVGFHKIGFVMMHFLILEGVQARIRHEA